MLGISPVKGLGYSRLQEHLPYALDLYVARARHEPLHRTGKQSVLHVSHPHHEGDNDVLVSPLDTLHDRRRYWVICWLDPIDW